MYADANLGILCNDKELKATDRKITVNPYYKLSLAIKKRTKTT